MLLILYIYIKIVEKYETYLVFTLGLLIDFLYLIRIEGIIFLLLPFVSFYSGSEKFWVSIPYTSVDNVIKFAKSRNVNYIIIDQRYVGMRDNYEELENLNNSFDNVELIFEDNSIKPIKVFKLNK